MIDFSGSFGDSAYRPDIASDLTGEFTEAEESQQPDE
jgi:hypothetical protein